LGEFNIRNERIFKKYQARHRGKLSNVAQEWGVDAKERKKKSKSMVNETPHLIFGEETTRKRFFAAVSDSRPEGARF